MRFDFAGLNVGKHDWLGLYALENYSAISLSSTAHKKRLYGSLIMQSSFESNLCGIGMRKMLYGIA